jgi:hypothetical protein
MPQKLEASTRLNIKNKSELNPGSAINKPAGPIVEGKSSRTAGIEQPRTKRASGIEVTAIELQPFGMRPGEMGTYSDSGEAPKTYDNRKQTAVFDVSKPLDLRDAETAWRTTPDGKKDPPVDST